MSVNESFHCMHNCHTQCNQKWNNDSSALYWQYNVNTNERRQNFSWIYSDLWPVHCTCYLTEGFVSFGFKIRSTFNKTLITFSKDRHTNHSTFQGLSNSSLLLSCQHWSDPSFLPPCLTVHLVRPVPPTFWFRLPGSGQKQWKRKINKQ